MKLVEMTQSSWLFTLTELLNTIRAMMFFLQPEAETGSTIVASGENLEGFLILETKEVQVTDLEDLQGEMVTGAQA